MADNVSVGQPSSGTYGEGTDLDNLKKALPQGAIGNPSNVAPQPPAPPIGTQPPQPIAPAAPGRPAGPTGPPGVPSVLLAPTTQPDTPVNTPLQAPPAPMGAGAPGAVNPQQARMAVLDALVHSPNVSDETKQWAQSVIRVLLSSTAS